MVTQDTPQGCGPRAHLQDLPKQAQVLVQEDEPGLEAGHAAQHQRMVGVIPRLIPRGPPPLQQLQRLLPADVQEICICPFRSRAISSAVGLNSVGKASSSWPLTLRTELCHSHSFPPCSSLE